MIVLNPRESKDFDKVSKLLSSHPEVVVWGNKLGFIPNEKKFESLNLYENYSFFQPIIFNKYLDYVKNCVHEMIMLCNEIDFKLNDHYIQS